MLWIIAVVLASVSARQRAAPALLLALMFADVAKWRTSNLKCGACLIACETASRS